MAFRYELYSGSDKQIQGTRSDRVPEELCMEVRNSVEEVVTKEKEMQKGRGDL